MIRSLRALPAILLALAVLATAPAALAPPALAQAAADERAREEALASAAATAAGVTAPSRVELLDQASLRLTGEMQFVPRDTAARLLRAYWRPVPPGMIGLLRYTDRAQWIATLRFVADGFVDPAELKSWSDEDLLASLRDEVAATNPERERQGRSALEVTGWLIPPRYDPTAHAVEWAALMPAVNATRERDSEAVHNIAVFGRDGYLLIEITGPAGNLRDGGADYRTIVDNLRYNPGKGFDDFQRGRDRMASNGLETLLGVRTLRHRTLLEGQLDSDRIMILVVGGGLVLGAGGLGLALMMVNRRRLRRRPGR